MERAALSVSRASLIAHVPIELVFFIGVNTTHKGIVTVKFTRTRQWDGRLVARTEANFGHFEVSLRNPQVYTRVRSYFSDPMPEVPTGDPRTDALLRLRTDNPQIAAPLGTILAPLTTLAYVHVIGRPGEVSFLMSHADAGTGNEMIGVGWALQSAELIYDVLTRVVLTAEGRA